MRCRRKRVLAVVLPGLFAAFATGKPPVAVIDYSIVDLGAFPAGFVPFFTPNAVHNARQAVGYTDPIGEDDRPIYYDTNGNTAIFETLGGLARALSLNEFGQAAGIPLHGSAWHAVRWDPPGFGQDIPGPGVAALMVVGLLAFGVASERASRHA